MVKARLMAVFEACETMEKQLEGLELTILREQGFSEGIVVDIELDEANYLILRERIESFGAGMWIDKL